MTRSLRRMNSGGPGRDRADTDRQIAGDLQSAAISREARVLMARFGDRPWWFRVLISPYALWRLCSARVYRDKDGWIARPRIR